MSVKAMMATILQNQLTLRGVHSLTPSDYDEIVELLIEQLRELELNLAVREIADNHEPHRAKEQQKSWLVGHALLARSPRSTLLLIGRGRDDRQKAQST
ncbi:hypothetical protein FXV83_07735 [Bradyrhizobium hipponense]|uniref:Uncharacterized protein n=1 Tax=Bradyrhizobium hipponense TaxID=2605638 RepID=A0A5S4YUA8_9BRAD|nr:hypothetical protein [Bradyrhizobium hipponense]TYO67087.1 hypothetical protein FXV83_07735 [Bradyrhizobium hipponense]